MRGYGAYLRVQNVAEPPRAVERRLMGAVTAALIAARDAPDDLAPKFDAILWNKRVWDSFIAEVADDTNGLPKELKSGIIRLGAWVTRETQMVMDGISTPDMLIEVDISDDIVEIRYPPALGAFSVMRGGRFAFRASALGTDFPGIAATSAAAPRARAERRAQRRRPSE